MVLGLTILSQQVDRPGYSNYASLLHKIFHNFCIHKMHEIDTHTLRRCELIITATRLFLSFIASCLKDVGMV